MISPANRSLNPERFSELLRASAFSDRGLRRRQPRYRDAERAARDVVEAELVAQVDGVRVSPMLAADPDLEVLARLASFLDRDLHQTSHTGHVNRLERVARKDLLFEVADDESPLGVVARETERG